MFLYNIVKDACSACPSVLSTALVQQFLTSCCCRLQIKSESAVVDFVLLQVESGSAVVDFVLLPAAGLKWICSC